MFTGCTLLREDQRKLARRFFFFIVESEFHSGERLVFIFNRGGYRSELCCSAG